MLDVLGHILIWLFVLAGPIALLLVITWHPPADPGP